MFCMFCKLFDRPLGSDNRDCIISAFKDIEKNCSIDGWDNYGAEKITNRTLDLVRRFIQILPYVIPYPDICPSPSGGIGLEWINREKDTLVVEIKDGMPLNYVFFDRHYSTKRRNTDQGVFEKGSYVFEDVVPTEILSLLYKYFV